MAEFYLTQTGEEVQEVLNQAPEDTAKITELEEEKYQVPEGGIPARDMTEAVQQSLEKADTAYQVPEGGIPSSAMTQAVRESLAKADASAAADNVFTKSETYSAEQIDSMITTPNQVFVTVVSYSDLPSEGDADTIYRVAEWDGSQVASNTYAEYAWDGSQYILLSVKSGNADDIFDISAYTGDQYTDIMDALGASGANVPATVRKGGMSVKFINSETGKYEQWRYLGTSISTDFSDTSYWQGIDDIPNLDSKNLVLSGGVASALEAINVELGGIEDKEVIPEWEAGSIDYFTGDDNNHPDLERVRQRTKGYIELELERYDHFNVIGYESPFVYQVLFYNSDQGYIGAMDDRGLWYSGDMEVTNIPANTRFIRLTCKTEDSATPTIRVKFISKKGVKDDIDEINTQISDMSTQINEVNAVVFGGEDVIVHPEWEFGSINYINGDDNDDPNTYYTRKRTSFIPIEQEGFDEVKVAGYAPPYEFMVLMYKANEDFIDYLETTNWFTSDQELLGRLDSECRYIRICCKVDVNNVNPTLHVDSIMEGLSLAEVKSKVSNLTKNVIIVDKNGDGDYDTLTDALANAGDTPTNHVQIIVRSGSYEMEPKVSGVAPYREANRNLSIIGENQNDCILYNNIGFYDYTIGTDCSPLRLSGNVTIKNLTILSRSTEYDNYSGTAGYEGRENSKISYCIHRDMDAYAGSVFKVKDCILINDHMTCIGFGLRPHTELIVENCYCQCEQADSYSLANNYGVIYGHPYANSVGLGQNLSVINCQLVHKTSYRAIYMTAGQSSSATPQDTFGTFKFIGNAVMTTDISRSLVIVSGLSGFYEISPLSFNNRFSL